jgi:TATA-box binding protein (TBP) (component of TFIID and TFIIIB)
MYTKSIIELKKYEKYLPGILKGIKLSNTVVSFINKDLEGEVCKINLEKLIEYIKIKGLYYRYSPRKFSGITIRIHPNNKLIELYPNLKNKTISILGFRTGKLVAVGLKFSDSKHLQILKNLLEELLKESEVSEFVNLSYTIANKVFSFSLPEQIRFKNLNQLAMCSEWKNIEYNPAIFPGLTLRVPEIQPIFLIFNSNKIIFTGNKKSQDLEYGIRYLLKCLEEIN